MKKGKTLVIIVLCISLIAGITIGAGFSATGASKEEIKTSDLFYGYPYYLKPDMSVEQQNQAWNADYKLVQARKIADDVIGNVGKNMGDGIMSVITAFQNTDYVFTDLAAQYGLGSSMTEQCIDEATQQLLMQIVQDGNFAKTVVQINDIGVDTVELILEGENLLETAEYIQISADKKSTIKLVSEEASDAFALVGTAVSWIDMANYICFFEEVDDAMLEYMLETVDREDLKKGIQKIIDYKSSNYQKYLAEKYANPELISTTKSAFIKYAGLTDLNYATIAADIVYGACGKFMSAITGLGSAEDLLVAMKLADYANEFSKERNNLITKFKTEPVLPKDINEYEACYNLQIAATKAYVKATMNVDRTAESTLNWASSILKSDVSYEKHLEGCKLAIQQIDRENREVVKGNADRYYPIHEEIKIASPSNELKPNTIYLFEDSLAYGVELEKSELIVEPALCNIYGDVILKEGEVAISKDQTINIFGDVVSERYSYAWDAIDTVMVEGTLKVDGDFREQSYDYNPYSHVWYTNLTVKGEDALVEIRGDVYGRGTWKMESGTMNFLGADILLEGYWDRSDAIGLQDIGSGTIHIKSDNMKNIVLPSFGLEKSGENETPVDLTLTQPEEGAFDLCGEAKGHILKPIVKNLMITKTLTTGGAALQQMSMDITGNYEVLGDVDLIGTQLDVSGDMTVEGDVISKRYSYAWDAIDHVVVEGALNINGDFIEESYDYNPYGHVWYTNLTVKGEDALVEIRGDVYGRGTWKMESGTMNFLGADILLEGYWDRSDAIGLQDIGSGTIHIKSDNMKNIVLPSFGLEKSGENETPVDLTLTQPEEGAFDLCGEAKGHILKPIVKNLMITKTLTTGGAALQQMSMDITGNYEVLGDVDLIGTQLDVSGDMTVEGDAISKRYSYAWDAIDTVMVEGSLKVEGDFSEQSYDYNPYSHVWYTNLTVKGEDALVEIHGDVYSRGTWKMESGTMNFLGTDIWLDGYFGRSDAIGLQDIGSGTIHIKSDNMKNIVLPSFGLEKSGESETPVDLILTQPEEGAFDAAGTAGGHILTTDKDFSVAGNLQTGTLILGQIQTDITGRCQVLGNADFIGVTMDVPGTLEIDGNVLAKRIGADYNASDAVDNVTVTGTLKVGGDYDEFRNGGTQHYTNLTVDGEDALVEIQGDVFSRGNWNVESGTLRFCGTNVSVEGAEVNNWKTTGLDNLGTGRVEIQSEAANKIALRHFSIGKAEEDTSTSPMNVVLTQPEEGAFDAAGTAGGHILTTDKDFSVTGNLQTGALKLGRIQADITGNCHVQGNVDFVGVTMDVPGTLEIDGNVLAKRIGADYNASDAVDYVTVTGTLKVGGDFDEYRHGSTQHYTNLTVAGEDALVEIHGDVYSNGTWNMESGTMHFCGGGVALKGDSYNYRTYGLQDIGTGKVLFTGEQGGAVLLPMIELEQIDGVSPNCQIKKIDGITYLEPLGGGATIVTAKELTLLEPTVLPGGTYDVETTKIGYPATVDLDKDMVFAGNLYNYGTMKMISNRHILVEGDFVADAKYNQENLLTDGVLEIKGDFTRKGDYNNFVASGNHETCFTGTDEQTVDFSGYEKNHFNKLTIENTSDVGIVFASRVFVNGLFEHNQNAFTYYYGSAFVDSDGDGRLDYLDPYPTDSSIDKVTVSVETIEDKKYEGEPVAPEPTVKDSLGNTLKLGKDYTFVHRDNTKPGIATVTVNGRGIYSAEVKNVQFDIFCDHTYGNDATCDICEYVNPDIHVCSPAFVEGKAATCSKEGKRPYYQCECGKCFEDESRQVEIADIATWGILKKTDHQMTEWAETVPATCTVEGEMARNCTACVFIETQVIQPSGHKYSSTYTVDKKATTSADGSKSKHCTRSGCTEKSSVTEIPKISSVNLSTVNYTYNGSTKTPTVTVTDSEGTTLKDGTDYTVSYESGRTKIGEYKVTVTFKGNYSGTVEKTFKIKLAAPKISISNVASSGAIKLSWNAVSGADRYEIQRSVGNDDNYVSYKTTTSTSFTNTATTAGKTYYYRVRAIYDDKSSLNSAWGYEYQTCDLARPEVSISNVASSGKIKLSWNAVSGADGYEIQRSVGNDDNYVAYKTTTSTSFTNTATTAGKTYYYRVRAIYDGKSSANSAWGYEYQTCDLAAPEITVSGTKNPGKIVVSWSKVSGADRYYIYRATSKNGTYSKYDTTTSTTYTNSSVTKDKYYYYKVKAVYDGKSSANSAYSNMDYARVR